MVERKIPNKLFFKIGEVCELTDIQPYVLRYWETEFPTLAPAKNSSGQRIYRRRDIETVIRIKELLYGEGFTVERPPGVGDVLEMELNPYLLRPFSSLGELSIEYGSLPLLTWTGSFDGNTFAIAPVLKTSKSSATFFNSLNSAATISRLQRTDTGFFDEGHQFVEILLRLARKAHDECASDENVLDARS